MIKLTFENINFELKPILNESNIIYRSYLIRDEVNIFGRALWFRGENNNEELEIQIDKDLKIIKMNLNYTYSIPVGNFEKIETDQDILNILKEFKITN